MRTFSGSDQFKELSDSIISSYSKVFPVENNGHKLEMEKIWLDNEALDPKDYTAQKKAKLAGSTWGAPLYASLVLKDQSGKVLDKMDKVRLATIPRVTPRGSYIVGGNEYQVANQMIRKTGAYVIKSQKGDEFKGMIALGGDRQQNFEIHFDPTKNKYTAKIQQANIPLYPLLKSLGVSDEQMRHAWGPEIFAVNKVDKESAYSQYADKLSRVKTDNKQTAMESIQAFAKSTKVDPDVTHLTLNHKYDHLTGGMLLDTTKKILHTYQGKAEADDPENLLFKEIRSVEDMLYDKIGSSQQQTALKKMLSRHLGRRNSIKQMIDFKKLSSPVESFFVTDNRTSTPEQYNPVHMVAEQNKLTIHGTGGITSEHAVSTSLREVHPSHVGFIDSVHTPESSKTGTSLHFASAVVKDGRNVRTFVKNLKTGKMELLTPQELYFKTVAFPDEMHDGKWKDPKQVRTQNQGKISALDHTKVDYILPDPTALFSHTTNLVPFLKNDQGTRAMMADKMLTQAIPLVHREAPLVQTKALNGNTFQDEFGKAFAIRAEKEGTVTEIHPDYIKIGNDKIPLYNNFPLNQKTHVHHEPLVKVGDKVHKGQLVADSNFTKDGTLAIGKNLNVAYLPYPGLTFEDGIVITESAAKKLAATQMYPHSFMIEPGKRETSLKKFLGYYPTSLDKAAIANYDPDGVIKKGTVVKPGQMLIAGLSYNLDSTENQTLRRINKSLMLPWSDSSVKYKGENEGVVTDVVKRGDKVEVFVKSVETAKEADKLSGVHGNKGVITKVIPDHEAPRDKHGNIPDVFLNPHGIIGRINLGQMFEAAAGKIAKKTGKPYVIKNFDNEDTVKKISEDLKKHGLSDTEELFTPDGKSLGHVSVGSPYILRLAKTGKSGFSARTPGSGYDINLQPIKGGEEGTKSLDLLTFYSMLSHGAKKNLIDAHQKSEKNDEYWHALEMGKPLPSPKPTFAFEKFTSLLRGAGINTDKKGSDFYLAPMTDKDTLKLSKGKVTDPEFLYGKDLKEKKGGFFDTTTTGGLSGKNYTHIELPERMANPVFEGAIKSLTNIKSDQYNDLVAGKLHVDPSGNLVTTHGKHTKTGGEGIAELLKKINIDSDLSKYKQQIKKEKNPSNIDSLNRKVRYLTALKDLNMDPVEAYTRKVVPVIPPVFRPIQEIQGRGLQVAPANILYQRVGLLAKSHEYPVMKLLGDAEKTELRDETYKATRALAGLEAVETRGKDQPIEGFISQITGSSPKQGFFLNKLVTKRQDLVGRGVITNGPDLHVDELGIPEKMAWNLFRPFTVREFTMSGYKPDFARKEIEGKTALAKKMMESAMSKRTVMMNRAPSLHKFSIMAFKPKLSEGLDIRVPPLTFKGMSADVDGDAVQLHVPTSEEAVRESVSMFPSNNLWKPGTGELMLVPSQESAIGIYFLSHSANGRDRINKILPKQYHINSILTAKGASDLYNKIAKEMPKEFPNIVHEMKSLGDIHAYEKGFTASLNDIKVDTKLRDALFKRADAEVLALKKSHKPGAELDNKISGIYEKAAQDSYKHLKEELKKNDSSFYHMIASGARGKDSQLMQLVSAPGIVLDAKDRRVPVPIKKSYAEGVSTSDYFMSSYGVRKGMIDRSLQTSKPGALNKDLMAAAVDNIITKEDCGTHSGIKMPITSPDVYDRYTATNQYNIPRNTLITPQVISQLSKSGHKDILVRSPLKCIAPKGTCAHCYGHDEFGKLPSIGENVGAKNGQAMSEPMTQMVMRTFHTGGVSTGAPKTSGFQRVSQLLNMPKYVSGEASLSPTTGKVTKIQKSAAGGFHIGVGDNTVSTRPGLKPLVAVGDTVRSGDKLTDGVVKPQELLRHKGMFDAQNYIVDELQNTYKEQGIPMQRKVFETVLRSVANNTRVIDAPKHSDFIPGDVIPYTTAVHYNATRAVELPVHEAIGYRTKEAIGKLPQFHEITDKDVSYLKGMGYNDKITVVKDPLVHAPMLTGITQLPMLRKDWMSQLGYRYIKKTLTEGAAQKWTSNVEGTHPIPAFAYGASFGKKKEHY